MSKSRHTEAQMIGALKQLEAGRKAEDVARRLGVAKHTIYGWLAHPSREPITKMGAPPNAVFVGWGARTWTSAHTSHGSRPTLY